MDKLRVSSILLVLCMLIIIAFASTSIEEEEKIKKPSLVERITPLLYVSSPSGSTTNSEAISTSNWDKLKAIVNQAHAYFFPPNLDFRGGKENVPTSGHVTSPATGEKVKEAMAASLEKSKEAVEDSAKSAAKIAGETVHKTKEKLKNSLSSKQAAQESEL